MQDSWTQSLILLFVFSSASACAMAFFHAVTQIVMRVQPLSEILTRPVLLVTGGVVAVQAGLSLLAIEFARRGVIPTDASEIIVGNWLLLILAVAALPGALMLARDSPANTDSGEWPRKFVFGCALAVLGISFLFYFSVLIFDDYFSVPEDLQALLENESALWLFLGVVVLAPFIEEVIFRGAMQGILERLTGTYGQGWPPVIITSLFWASGHVGILQPGGFKELQIFLVGLILGRLRQRAGLGAAILVHLILNLAAVLGELVLNRSL